MTVTIDASAHDGAPSLIAREAVKSDDSQICELMRRIVMPGGISLAASYEPSFFEAVEVEGQSRRVVVAEREEKIVGAGLMAGRCVYLNGKPAQIGYISSLRTDPSIRHTTALGRGNKIFKQWHEEYFHSPFYLCSILKDNLLARKIITSGRAGLPATKDVGMLYTAAIPLIRRVKPHHSDLRIIRGGEAGADAIVEFLNTHGQHKQFYPVYTVDDLLRQDGVLRGLGVDDFHVALDGDRMVGVIACWNQLPFRRMIVAGYSGIIKFARPFVSAIARAMRLAPLPKTGEAIQSVMAACIGIENNNPRVFEALLKSVLRAEYNTGKTFLLVGLMESDPLLEVVRKYIHIPTRSCIYSMQWDGSDVGIDDRVPYLELGSL